MYNKSSLILYKMVIGNKKLRKRFWEEWKAKINIIPSSEYNLIRDMSHSNYNREKLVK